MNKSYWETQADDYDENIFSVRHNDTNHIIRGHIEKYGAPLKSAGDFGCGPGYFLPYLSQNYKKVNGYDISAKLIELAAKLELPNVTVARKDLSKSIQQDKQYHFILCVNTLITESLSIRRNILTTITRSLKRNGILVLVVPSTESFQVASALLTEWNIQDGLSHAKAQKSDFEKTTLTTTQVYQGIRPIENVPTKHYVKDEFDVLAKVHGFKLKSVEKINYTWDTEYNSPPKWFNITAPWDWCAVFEKQ